MIRLLSYIYPITKKIESKYNGTLELTWFRGKKLLNTKNANYSYGSLEKILKLGFNHIDLKRCNNILLLGLGGGNVVKTLQDRFQYKGYITALEIDPVIVQIANDEYGIKNSEKLTIICDDAYNYVMKTSLNFDFIIIDLFLDDIIPLQFFDIEFWLKLSSANQLLFNGSLHGNNNEQLNAIIQMLEKHRFYVNKLDNVNKTNTLIIAIKN